MIDIPVSTGEKPLTAVDYIACLCKCVTALDVRRFAEQCPDAIRADERFAKAIASRLVAIRESQQ